MKANTRVRRASTDPTRVFENRGASRVYPDGYQPYITYAAEDIAAVGGVRLQGAMRSASLDAAGVVRSERNGTARP